jgi:hypothetical protein
MPCRTCIFRQNGKCAHPEGFEPDIELKYCVNERTVAKDRDTATCSICKRLGSGVRLSNIFVCDSCGERLGVENVGEINEMWG